MVDKKQRCVMVVDTYLEGGGVRLLGHLVLLHRTGNDVAKQTKGCKEGEQEASGWEEA